MAVNLIKLSHFPLSVSLIARVGLIVMQLQLLNSAHSPYTTQINYCPYKYVITCISPLICNYKCHWIKIFIITLVIIIMKTNNAFFKH